jgi:hypothetical protein
MTRAQVLDFMDAQAKERAAAGHGGQQPLGGGAGSSSTSGGGSLGGTIRDIIKVRGVGWAGPGRPH